jgi:hypothetical protein
MEKQVFFDFKPHFNLRSKRTDKATSVYLVFRTNDGKQYKINTHAKVYSNQWNNGKVISSTINDMKNNDILLLTISEYKTKFFEFKNYLCNTNNVDIEQAISIFFKYKPMTKKAEKQTKCLTLLLNEVIDKSDSREKSKIQYHSIVSVFKQFLLDKNIANTIDSARLQIFEQYQSYLLNEKGINRQTINNKITVLTTLLKKLSRTESSIDIDSIKKLEKLKVDKDIENDKFVVLPISDIKKLLDTNIDNEGKEFTDIEKLVKDIFCLECLSGQRIEDILDLLQNRDKNEIKESDNIKFILHVCDKTRTKCFIPLNIFCIDTQSLLNRIYDNKELQNLLAIDSTVKINDKIKSIFKRLGYNSIVTWKEQDAKNKLVDKQDYFYNRISTHSGRRSFITNSAKMGLNDNIIMLFSGHKEAEMLNRYKKLNDSDKINMAANAINNLHGVPKQSNIPSNTTVSTNSNTENELLNESKKVLAYLGANAIEIADIKGIDEAMRMLYQDYEYKLKQMGLTATQIKEIYNSDRPTLKSKREALLKLVEDIEKKESPLQ